jgi:hypothetical protein
LALAQKLNVPMGTPRLLARLRLADLPPHDDFQQPVLNHSQRYQVLGNNGNNIFNLYTPNERHIRSKLH